MQPLALLSSSISAFPILSSALPPSFLPLLPHPPSSTTPTGRPPPTISLRISKTSNFMIPYVKKSITSSYEIIKGFAKMIIHYDDVTLFSSVMRNDCPFRLILIRVFSFLFFSQHFAFPSSISSPHPPSTIPFTLLPPPFRPRRLQLTRNRPLDPLGMLVLSD